MRAVLCAEVEYNDMVRTKTEAILVDALAAKAHLVAVSRFVCACECHIPLPTLVAQAYVVATCHFVYACECHTSPPSLACQCHTSPLPSLVARLYMVASFVLV